MASINGVCTGVKNGFANGKENGVTNGEENGVTNGVLKKRQHDTNGFAQHSAAKKVVNDIAANGSLSQNLATIPGKTDLEFLRKVVDIVIQDGLIGAMDRNTRVCDFHQPENLKTMLKELTITEDPASEDRLLNMCKDVIQYSVKTSNPRFFNQLYGGMDQYTLGGAWVTEALNPSQYTYEVSPVFTLMEEEVYKKMLHYIGFDGGDAIFVPGGSLANVYGMNVARYAKVPEVKTKGSCALQKPLCIFTSEKCHYSVQKSAELLCIGRDNIFFVKTDKKGKMIPAELENQINKAKGEGYEPFFVNATAGTTVLGAYDPLDEISEVCKKHGLWLHVDGAWGGSAAISKKYRYLVKGIEKADSMTWNAHKMMGVIQQCSVFLTKHKGVLQDCHSAKARYLFQQDKSYDVSYDTGDKSLQCGRKVDVFKLWMLWKGKGDSGMERDIDHLFMLSRYLANKLKQTSGFRLIQEPECTNVCFWYIPPSMRDQEETKEWWDKLAKVAPAIKTGMLQCGSMMITYNPDGDLVNFFRMVQSNFDTTTDDMDFLVQEIDRLGRDL
ncbi:cysteine sulfinic acid decarboxylase-like [Mercenaria mercenaria]|uniref:cysteine sulfinic acid decarboxylase-like n=1 Tax=Mercenaria mercenaria TaxID=6596 RepID=UPI001E1D8542|nr:cysteine sulfinic acid decarboxylase-like [Mercenaria mercenaria]XP_045164729.1 cysteine sulfinic acid decarboxylase-like [Mercenaria mercenaria]XP_045164738.1 cysteine sulfinic acid decarboxylase-like [Mercenaria mercenaria]